MGPDGRILESWAEVEEALLGSNEAVRARTEAVYVDRDFRKKIDGLTASDHAPVIADLA